MKVKFPDNTRFISAEIKCTSGTHSNDRMVMEVLEDEYLITVYDGMHTGLIIMSQADAKALANLLADDLKKVEDSE